MNHSALPFTLVLAACGTSSSPSNQPTSQECKGNRIWDETKEECIEPTPDASLEDAVTQDAGNVQMYEGKLYGVYQLASVNSAVPSYLVTFDFQTGRLEQLVSQDGSIISLPPGAIHVESAAFSPDQRYFITSLSFDSPASRKIYLFDLKDSSATFLTSDIGVAQFSWKDSSTYFMSLTEEGEEDQTGNYLYTRIYQKKVGEISSSHWFTEDRGRFIMPLSVVNDNVLAFLCHAKDADPMDVNAELEICSTTPANSQDLPLVRESEGRRGDFSFASSFVLSVPNTFDHIVYSPCSKGQSHNYLCSFNVLEYSKVNVVTQIDDPVLRHILFSPDEGQVILNDKSIFDLTEKVDRGTFLPLDIQFQGKPVDRSLELRWFEWR